jgi:membrane-associated protein
MADWLAQIGELPAAVLMATLGVVMMLDTIPLAGVLVPGDVAVIAAVGARGVAGGGAVLASVVGGCVSGWSLTFMLGRLCGDRIRRSRFGAWIGEARWAAAERAVTQGGTRMVLAAPFLPFLNTLVPLAAGGLRMSYRRFLPSAALGSALWAALYVALGMTAHTLGGLLPGGSYTTGGTMLVGLGFGWVALVGARRKLRSTGGDTAATGGGPVAAEGAPVTAGGDLVPAGVDVVAADLAVAGASVVAAGGDPAAATRSGPAAYPGPAWRRRPGLSWSPAGGPLAGRPGVAAGPPGRRGRRQRSLTRPAPTSIRRVVHTAPSMRRSWVTRSRVPLYESSADSSCSMAGRSRWLVGSSSTSTFAPSTVSRARAARLRSPPESEPSGCKTIFPCRPKLPSKSRIFCSLIVSSGSGQTARRTLFDSSRIDRC